jgi:hypothetical protein
MLSKLTYNILFATLIPVVILYAKFVQAQNMMINEEAVRIFLSSDTHLM